VNLEERRKRRDEIARMIVTRIFECFNQSDGIDPIDLMVTRTPYQTYELGAGWAKLAEEIVERLAERKVIDLEKSQCTCPLDTLMALGCQCGEALFEKIKKAGT